jgi:outer membrane immunogenic protein
MRFTYELLGWTFLCPDLGVGTDYLFRIDFWRQTMMKAALAFSVVAVSAFTVGAKAADVTPTAVYDWTGFYAGVTAGASGNNSEIDQEYSYVSIDRHDEVSERFDNNQTAFTGGALLGYNYQISNVVLGIETDLNYLGFSDVQKRSGSYYVIEPWNVDATYKGKAHLDANWYGTLRGRLGYAMDNLLIYGTGGLAYGGIKAGGDLEISTSLGGMEWDGHNTSTKLGWALGGGLEYGLNRWTLGAEYLFVDLNRTEWDGKANGPWALANTDLTGWVDYQFSVVRATARLRF